MTLGGKWTAGNPRRTALLAVAVVCAVVAAGIGLQRYTGWGGRAARAPIRKIILLSIDALRADRLGCYGYRRADTSPTIDAWAQQAVVFERAYAQAPWTVPSLGSLLAGRDPRETGAYTNSGDVVSLSATLPERLQQAGYRTAFFNTNPVLFRKGISRGFDSVAPGQAGKKIPYTSTEPLVMEWLDQHAQDSFFLWIHNMDPHSPPTEGNPYLGAKGWARYDAEVRWVDEATARLFAKLEALGIRDEVLFIFTADHGEAFGEHQLSGHQDVIYDEVLHVPLIVQYPGMEYSGRVTETVQLLDLTATISELAGLPRQQEARGESLVSLIEDPTDRLKHPFVFSARYYFASDRVNPKTGKVLLARGQHHFAVRDRQWKLIARLPGTAAKPTEMPDWTFGAESASHELYDIDRDPREKEDLFDAKPEVASRLAQALAEWKRATSGGPTSTTATLDPAMQEAMRALGYGSE